MISSIGPFVCITVASVVLLSCFFQSDVPIMSNKVVSYQMIGYKSEHLLPGYWKNDFILGKDTLESWFPHIFGDKQAESKCNYFAMYFATSSTLTKYWVLSQDMVLYKIKPGNTRCAVSDDAIFHAMLVCDDTEEGNLKDKIDLNSIRSVVDEDWDCEKGRKNVFF